MSKNIGQNHQHLHFDIVAHLRSVGDCCDLVGGLIIRRSREKRAIRAAADTPPIRHKETARFPDYIYDYCKGRGSSSRFSFVPLHAVVTEASTEKLLKNLSKTNFSSFPKNLMLANYFLVVIFMRSLIGFQPRQLLVFKEFVILQLCSCTDITTYKANTKIV